MKFTTLWLVAVPVCPNRQHKPVRADPHRSRGKCHLEKHVEKINLRFWFASKNFPRGVIAVISAGACQETFFGIQTPNFPKEEKIFPNTWKNARVCQC